MDSFQFARAGAISIHAPHARSDFKAEDVACGDMISIHAPHARSDLAELGISAADLQFQSTLLMRGATQALLCSSSPTTNFNPRSSCEERLYHDDGRNAVSQNFNPRSSCEERQDHRPRWALAQISIHAPHARSDFLRHGVCPRHPISIHAPHARSDSFSFHNSSRCIEISIHAPHARSDHRLSYP